MVSYRSVEGGHLVPDKQISAIVSEGTSTLLERYARANGVKKGFLIEAALLHHLEALREVPEDVVIPPRVVVSKGSMTAIAELLERPPAPTKAMRKLMS
jgi:uncharacterized protein (DUF1778 family)